jgi:hypothetical protein
VFTKKDQSNVSRLVYQFQGQESSGELTLLFSGVTTRVTYYQKTAEQI